MKDIPIGIIGLGFVGDAIKHGLEHYGYKNFRIYDPYKIPESKVEDISITKLCFICVPTPMSKGGEMDKTALVDVLDNLSKINYEGIVVIKSTVIPTVIKEIVEVYPHLKIISNPEFLTERRARQDFIDTTYIILGGDQKNCILLRKIYKTMFPEAKIVIVSAEAAMMAKYMTNTFFATKISLMNEFYHLWGALGFSDWKDVIKAFRIDTRVNANHTQVPGPDGDTGFGGKCFGKDLNALNSLAKKMDVPNYVMSGAWEDNKFFRHKKDWLEIEGAVTQDYIEENHGK